MPDDVVTLKIGGVVYSGWESVSISRDLGELCAAFQLGLFYAAGQEVDLAQIRDMAACEVWLGNDPVITGYIDNVRDGITDTGSSLSVSGRDRTCDLVDCSAVNAPGTWRAQTLIQIATALVAPFGIEVILEGNPAPGLFKLFALEPGETAFEALSRLCRTRGALMRTSTTGQLIIYQQSGARANGTLELGRNLLGLQLDTDSSGRFSQYIVKGQHSGADTAPKDAAQPRASASDPGVNRHRPLVIISDEQSTLAGLKSRASWEASTRKGLAVSADATIQGWRDDAGELWRPGITVPVKAASRGIEADMVISGVSFTRDMSGSRTALKLAPADAFRPEIAPETKPETRRASR